LLGLPACIARQKLHSLRAFRQLCGTQTPKKSAHQASRVKASQALDTSISSASGPRRRGRRRGGTLRRGICSAIATRAAQRVGSASEGLQSKAHNDGLVLVRGSPRGGAQGSCEGGLRESCPRRVRSRASFVDTVRRLRAASTAFLWHPAHCTSW